MKLSITILLLFFASNLSAQSNTSKPATLKKDSIRIISGVLVNGVVNSKTLRQQPVNVSIVDARPFYNTNVNALDLLKQVSGIKVKQDGGFGSKNEFFINGNTGKQVKFFIDGLPQDNLGETQMLNIYPVEQIERIEIYKGVLPVDLGADALGAAINIITRKERENYFDASYSAASFNTHKVNFSSKKYITKSFFAAIQVNANYAKNNYTIDGEVPNAVGTVEVKQVNRFHDAFKNYNIKIQAGLVDKPYADQLIVGFINTGMYRDIQNNFVMTQPYGMANYREHLLSGNVRYQKANIFKNFNLSSSISFNRVDGLFTDTSKNVYVWSGDVVSRKLSGGEISSSGHELHLYTNVLNAKLTATYALSKTVKLVFSNTYQYYNRTGKDTVAQQFYNGADYFATPSAMTKNITGIGLEGNILKQKLRFSTAIKNNAAKLNGYEIEWFTQTVSTQTMHAIAYNAAVAYKLNDAVLLKTSYEHAARLPETEEAFGDLIQVRPNPNIQIERSENININALFFCKKIEAEIGGFYRDVTNIIYLRPAQTSSIYQNLLSVKVLGVEGSMRYQPINNLFINGNITYQDLRNQSVIDNSGINNDRYKNARMPNTPYLFMNAGISYKKEHCLKKNSTLQLWWNSSYTHEYFLYWEVDGARELKNRIPTQLLHYAGISYALANTGLSFALEVNNISNAKTYDNFKVQLPGRSFSFKIRIYQFKKTT
ncbi:MAG: TonB-dependent receptor [Ferruginibacter sp.]